MIKPYIKATTFVLLLAILFYQCTKIDTTTVGSGLIPGVDNIHTFDTTFQVIGNNFDGVNECDSIGYRDLLASGIITQDPRFGSAYGEMYFNFKPATFPVSLPTHDTLSMVVDSVILVLKYNHSFGDTNMVQKLNVYELAQTLKSDSIYRTCEQMTHFNDLLGSATFTPVSLKDSIHAFGEDDASQLRIKLDTQLGIDFIEKYETLTSDSAFNLFFRGFAVIPDESTGGQALNYFDLTSTSSRLSIYVTSSRDTVRDTSVINLAMTSFSSQANYLKKERGTSEITQHLDNNPNGDDVLFIQAYPSGSYATLKIPGLNSFPNSVVHRAELVLQEEYDPGALDFRAPQLLYLDIQDTAGNYIGIPCDFSVTEVQAGFPNLGGKPATITDDNGKQVVRYTFNISRYVQTILTKKMDNATIRLRAPFYIENFNAYVDRCSQVINPFSYPTNSSSDGGVKLFGTGLSSTSAKLHVVYSKL